RNATVMTTSIKRTLPAFLGCAGRRLIKAGFLSRHQLGEGGPRALAAFFERPQASCSNLRYVYSLESPIGTVNERIRADHPDERRMILHQGCRPTTIPSIAPRLSRACRFTLTVPAHPASRC